MFKSYYFSIICDFSHNMWLSLKEQFANIYQLAAKLEEKSAIIDQQSVLIEVSVWQHDLNFNSE